MPRRGKRGVAILPGPGGPVDPNQPDDQSASNPATVVYRAAGSGLQALVAAAKWLSLPRNGVLPVVPSDRKLKTARPSVKTVVRSSIVAPLTNSSGAMNRLDPNCRPRVFV